MRGLDIQCAPSGITIYVVCFQTVVEYKISYDKYRLPHTEKMIRFSWEKKEYCFSRCFHEWLYLFLFWLMGIALRLFYGLVYLFLPLLPYQDSVLHVCILSHAEWSTWQSSLHQNQCSQIAGDYFTQLVSLCYCTIRHIIHLAIFSQGFPTWYLNVVSHCRNTILAGNTEWNCQCM